MASTKHATALQCSLQQQPILRTSRARAFSPLPVLVLYTYSICCRHIMHALWKFWKLQCLYFALGLLLIILVSGNWSGEIWQSKMSFLSSLELHDYHQNLVYRQIYTCNKSTGNVLSYLLTLILIVQTYYRTYDVNERILTNIQMMIWSR